MSHLQAILVFSFYVLEKTNAVPPEACFANFRWDDCGGFPTKVLYYWKPGSRCEVGVWRGCLPNLNMFKTEYECVETCIFRTKAEPKDYHKLGEDDQIETTTESGFETTEGTTFIGTETSASGDGNSTTVSTEGSPGTKTTIDTKTDAADGTTVATITAGGGDVPTTSAPAAD